MAKPEGIEEGATFDLGQIQAEVREEAAFARTGRTARTLVRTEDLRVVLVVMAKDNQIEKHQADRTVSIQVLRGKVRLQLPEQVVELGAGQLLVLERGLNHDVQALEESAFLLTLG